MFRIFILLTLFCICLTPATAQTAKCSSNDTRVIVVENPDATDSFKVRTDQVRPMVIRGIMRITGATNEIAAWQTLVSPKETIGIKVLSEPGLAGTRPAVVESVVQGLLAAGIPRKKIIIWDKRIEDLQSSGFVDLARRYRIRAAGARNTGYDEKADFYENALIGNLVWGDAEFGRKGEKIGRKSFISKLVTREITRIINIAPLLHHNAGGVNGILVGLALGSADNTQRFETRPDMLAVAVPDIYSLPPLADKVALNIIDALIAQYQGEQVSLMHYSTALNQLWLSMDPVALDTLAVQELDRDRQASGIEGGKTNVELYQNAGLCKLGTNVLSQICIDLVK